MHALPFNNDTLGFPEEPASQLIGSMSVITCRGKLNSVRGDSRGNRLEGPSRALLLLTPFPEVGAPVRGRDVKLLPEPLQIALSATSPFGLKFSRGN